MYKRLLDHFSKKKFNAYLYYFMKKTLTAFAVVAYLLSSSSCFILQKKEKFGCPGNGRSIGAEKLAAGDDKALRASSKANYKGRKSY